MENQMIIFQLPPSMEYTYNCTAVEDVLLVYILVK